MQVVSPTGPMSLVHAIVLKPLRCMLMNGSKFSDPVPLPQCKTNCPRAGQKLVPLVKRAFFCLRSVPTAMLFHSIATLLLRVLVSQQPPEEKAAKALQRHYLVKHDRRPFKVQDWSGDPNSFYTADWWCGLQRLQPGSASGTQAQESWHRWKLKENTWAFALTCLPLPKAWPIFTKSRLMDLRGQGSCLPDMPPEPFPDKTVLWDSDALTRQGLSSADQFFRTQAWDRFDEEDGTSFLCMRRTLATYDHASNSWTKTSDNAVPCPSSGFAQAFANLVRANSEATLVIVRALISLGLAQPLLDLEKLLKLLDSYVLVAIGPFAVPILAARARWSGGKSAHTRLLRVLQRVLFACNLRAHARCLPHPRPLVSPKACLSLLRPLADCFIFF